MQDGLPLLDHALDEQTAFSPEALMEAVRAERHLPREPMPRVCVLELDGDLTDWLVSTGAARPVRSWACFHTTMYSLELDGNSFGVVPRTIGGPFSVLVAEQMAKSGAAVVLALTSAGRVSPAMPVPGLVAVASAVRDEGASYHYLAPARSVDAPAKMASLLESGLQGLPLPVRSGRVWTTDAPYRETESQMAGHAKEGVLAVEMQAASLFAFSKANRFPVGLVAYVTNSLDQAGKAFDKGSRQLEFEILKRICRAGEKFASSRGGRGPTSAAYGARDPKILPSKGP